MAEFSEAYGKLNSFIRQASCSSDALDYFDLNGDEPAMLAAWNWLVEQQRQSLAALVQHIVANADEIISAIGESPAEAPTEPPRALLRSGQLADWVYTALTHYAVNAERATRDPNKTIPDATKLPAPGKWERRGNTLVMRTFIPKD